MTEVGWDAMKAVRDSATSALSNLLHHNRVHRSCQTRQKKPLQALEIDKLDRIPFSDKTITRLMLIMLLTSSFLPIICMFPYFLYARTLSPRLFGSMFVKTMYLT